MGVPNQIMVPFVGIEFDPSRAFQGASALNYKVLFMGQKISSGSVDAGIVKKLNSADEVGKAFGFGSQIHQLSVGWFQNNTIQEAYFIALDDDVAGVKAEHTITITGPATKSGELAFYIGGTRVAVGVKAGDTASTIASAVAGKITSSFPVVATAVAGVITLVAKNAGTLGNDLDLQDSYNQGESIPDGLAVAYASSVTGAGDPSVAGVWDIIGDQWFQVMVGAYSDPTNLESIEAELEDRFGPIRQIDGMYISVKKDTESNLITFATNASRNSPHVSIFDGYQYPTSIAVMAGAVAGKVADSAVKDPAVPLHRQTLNGVLPPAIENRRKMLIRNTLASNGISTIDPNGVKLEATITMYLKNSAGAVDIAYQQMNTMFTLLLLRWRFVQRILGKYARAKLADDATMIRSGQSVITPAVGKAEAIAWFREAEADGLVENVGQFKADLVCRRSASNPNRLEWILPPDLLNQFIVGSGDLQFLLQSVPQ